MKGADHAIESCGQIQDRGFIMSCYISQTSGERKLGFQFCKRSQGDGEMIHKGRSRKTGMAFSDIGWNGNGSASDLLCKSKALISRKKLR